MTIAPGAEYWGILEGSRTVCTYLRDLNVSGRRMHLVAVPAEAMGEASERDREVRSTADLTLRVRVLLVPNVAGLRRAPTSTHAAEYHRWPAPPRLDDLLQLLDDPRALPLRQDGEAPAQVMLSEAEEDVEPTPADSANELATAAAALLGTGPAARNQTAAGGAGDSALQTILARLDQLQVAQADGLARLTAIEQRHVRLGSTGTFDMTGNAVPLSQDDRDMLAALLAQRPHVGPEPLRRPPATVPRAGSPQLPQQPPSAPSAPQFPAPPADPMVALALQLLAERAGTQPRHGVSPLTGGLSDEKLFKMEGARGRLAQDRLDRQLLECPEQVCAEFEEAVRREAPPEDPAELDVTLGQLQRAWRQTVPAKEHALVVRVSEALLHVYHHLRAGRTQQGMARVALLLAGLEQGVLDAGKMEKRGDTLMGMPRPPLNLYHAPAADERATKDGKGLGPMARLVAPVRATTARSVYLENAGAA